MNVPIVTRQDLTVVDINDDFVSLMDDDGEIREDLRVPENDVGRELSDKFEEGEEVIATVLKAMDEETIISVKVSNK